LLMGVHRGLLQGPSMYIVRIRYSSMSSFEQEDVSFVFHQRDLSRFAWVDNSH